MILLIIHSAACLLLSMVFIALLKGVKRAFAASKATSESAIPVTIIVAAHNEAENLPALLDAVEAQTYPHELITLIIVDDRSTDRTQDILSLRKASTVHTEVIRIDSVPKGVSPKKYALHTGIAKADTEALLFTDADCIPELKWVESLTGALQSSDVVLGASPMKAGTSFAARYAVYETTRTMAFMHGTANIGLPYMSLGRNWGYKKSLYERTGGLEPLYSHLGGDDDLLLQRFAQHKAKIVSCLIKDSFVPTTPPKNVPELFRQKQRHYSVSSSYSFNIAFALGGIQILEWIALLCISAIFLTLPLPYVLIAIGIVLIPEITLLALLSNTRQLPFTAGFFAVTWEVFHLFFSTISGIVGILKPRSW